MTHDVDRVRALGVQPVLADLLEEDHVARHDPRRLARLVLALAKNRKP